jgi:hypothetical protein
MKTYLKIKIVSLAAEARLIRREERRYRGPKWGPSPVRLGLHRHRIHEVRPEARHALLAYGFLRGRSYRQIESRAGCVPNWDRVQDLILKYGEVAEADRATTIQRFAEWQSAGCTRGGPVRR